MLIAIVIALPRRRGDRAVPPAVPPRDHGGRPRYTIPGLALLAVLVPVTGLNATTIIIPLVLYAQLVLIRNTVAAIDAVDPVLLEAARAMGMDRGQILRRVVMPLALPARRRRRAGRDRDHDRHRLARGARRRRRARRSHLHRHPEHATTTRCSAAAS